MRLEYDVISMRSRKRRMEVMPLWKGGLSQAEVARRVKVVRKTVVRWVAHYRERGKAALRKAGRAGRKPLLEDKDRQGLEELMVRGPEALGYETPLWTFPRIAHLIE